MLSLLSKAVHLRVQVPTGSFSLCPSLCELLGKLLIYEQLAGKPGARAAPVDS